MDTARKTTGRPRPLDSEQIAEAAVRCIAARGLDAMTIRAVAAEVGAAPMALYRHVADREELVRLAVDDVMAQVRLPPVPAADLGAAGTAGAGTATNTDTAAATATGAWLLAMAREVRRVLIAHPGVAEHLLVMGPAGPNGFAVMDRICAVLSGTGRSPAEAAEAYLWLMVNVAAFSARHTRAGEVADAAGVQRPELRDIFVHRTAPFAARFPHLAAVAGAFNTDPEATFDHAVGQVVAAIVGPAGGIGAP